MLQYSDIIHHASQLFIWENVYAYDIDFRIHMSKHPERSWGIILQQAWSLQLQDRVVKTPGFGNSTSKTWNSFGSSPNPGNSGHSSSKKKKICWDYNSGNCTFGFGCKFNHRCSICGKSGHGAFSCRKLKQKMHQGAFESHSKDNSNSSNSFYREDRDRDNHLHKHSKKKVMN